MVNAEPPGDSRDQVARLRTRPSTPTERGPVGLAPLGLDVERDTWLYVPAGYRASRPAPMIVLFHGAAGDAAAGLRPLLGLADEFGLLLLAPTSARTTWDVLNRGYGSDVERLDMALAAMFARYAVDPARLAIAGFSDGGSYAISIGLTNGDMFGSIVAFSPGFVAAAVQRGRPRIFISHGTRDDMLPIDTCGRRVASMLRRGGYDVTLREFDGPHVVPPEIAREAVDWLTIGPPPSGR